jgi:phage-related protein
VLGFYKGIFDGIVNGVNVVLGMIGKLVGAIKSIPSLPDIGGAVGGLIGKIPGLAEGGIVTGPTLAMVGEAGPEAVIPLSRMGQMGNVTININANVADERLGDVIVNALRQYNRRSGPVNIAVA